MITVLHTIDTTGPGGAESVFVNLAAKITPGRFRSVVAINGRGWVCDELRRHGLEPHILAGGRNSSFDLRYLMQLRTIVRDEGVDIIHSHLFGSNVYSSLAALSCRVPAISTFHGAVDIRGKNRFLRAKFAIINAGSRKIVFVSDYLREEILATTTLSRARAHRIYNGIDLGTFGPGSDDAIKRELGLPNDELLIGAVGNIRPAKGYDALLHAAALVAQSGAKTKFIIAGHAGGALYDSLLALRARLGLERQVFFLGHRQDVSHILRGLDIFVLPSTSEGLSIATIEAMACGLPVIATRSGGPEEIVKHKFNGILIDTRSPAQLAREILRLSGDAGLRYRLARNAAASAACFSETSMIAAYENLYAALIRQPPREASRRQRGTAWLPPTS